MKELYLFPLKIVVFPDELLNLHVFEARYLQLVEDCLAEGSTFGIPFYLNDKMEIGTEVKLIEISERLEDGKMNIKVVGLDVFEVHDYVNPWQEKLYAGGVIKMMKNERSYDAHLMDKFKVLLKNFFSWLDIAKTPKVEGIKSVFDVGHKIGLSIEEEHLLVEMCSENERLHFAIKHLNKIIPVLRSAEMARQRIKQNGHFKYLDTLNF